MVVGNGLIASAFTDYKEDPRIVFFASGVSNSLEEADEQFIKEADLLLNTLRENQNKRFVYFSTYSILYKQSKYTLHKMKMEELIKSRNPDALILRITNVVGKSNNPFTVLNYFTNRIRQKLLITIFRGTQRNLISIGDLSVVVRSLLNKENHISGVQNIGYPYSYSTAEIVACIEEFYGITALKQIAHSEERLVEDFFDISTLSGVTIIPKTEYLPLLLNTYYN